MLHLSSLIEEEKQFREYYFYHFEYFERAFLVREVNSFCLHLPFQWRNKLNALASCAMSVLGTVEIEFRRIVFSPENLQHHLVVDQKAK